MSRALLLSFVLGVAVSPARTAAEPAPEVMVVGSAHFWKSDAPLDPSLTSEVIERLVRFAPDHIAVEWLHPSIDPATTRNYLPLSDRDALATAWTSPLDGAGCPAVSIKKRGDSARSERAGWHVASARQAYLAGDRLNAGYQSWRAAQLGIRDAELAELTRDFFAGHEIQALAFPVAARLGLDYITPFDYQGEDADWRSNMLRLYRQVRAIAIHAVHGIDESDPAWPELVLGYNLTWVNFYRTGDPVWREMYGTVGAAAEYAAVFVDFRRQVEETIETASERFRFGRLGFFQTEPYLRLERRSYREKMAGLDTDSLGGALVTDWERRNARMIAFLLGDVERLGKHRILVLVGSGHKPFFEELLRDRGLVVVPSSDLLSDPR